MDYLSRIKQQSLINQLAFYALLASGAYIIFLSSPNVLGNYLNRYTKVIICPAPHRALHGHV
jgi:hypothetical protein